MNLDDWAATWSISPAALYDLRQRMGLDGDAAWKEPNANAGTPGSEARQSSLVRLEAAAKGVWLTRNNVGVLQDDTGRPVRYGLANESKEQNAKVKSGDQIGIKPVLITPSHVGLIIGQFISREVKHEGWRYTGIGREVQQLAWANFVISRGGDAGFCTGPGTI